MKLKRLYIYFSVAIFFTSFEINAQIVAGQVLDAETNEALPFANVYFNASLRGTSTDQHGEFKLNTNGYAGQDIVVSIIGYESWVIIDFQKNKYYKIYLKPASSLLREVVITHKDMPRKKKEAIFKREFLGTSSFAASCTIENMDEIILTYFKESKTLEGYCHKPLIIDNKALGYKIKYFLDAFQVNDDNMFYRGNFLFEEDTTLNTSEKNKALANRKNAYTGSRMHFFRDLWTGDQFGLEYFLFAIDSKYPLTKDSLISEEIQSFKYLHAEQENITIQYGQTISNIKFIDGHKIPFTKNGFFDSQYLLWSGEMAKERIGDLLPFEYWPQ